MRKMSLEEIQGLVQNHNNTETRRQGFFNQMFFELKQIPLLLQQYLLTEISTPKSSFNVNMFCAFVENVWETLWTLALAAEHQGVLKALRSPAGTQQA